MKIDNFALTMHQTCPAKYDLRIRKQWASRFKSGALGFGGAFHAGLAAWYKTHDITAALQAIEAAWVPGPVDDYRTLEKCLRTMTEYIRAYPSESFDVVGYGTDNPMVEVSFTLDTGMYLSCTECGPDAGAWKPGEDKCQNCGTLLEPIEYGGIFDTLVESNGVVWILEHKTTSQLGDYYFDQFKPNNQVTGYVWAAEKLTGRRVAGAIINAIGVYKVGQTRLKREPTSRSRPLIDEWLNNVRVTCEEIQQHERTGQWPMRTMACTLYGKCEFHSVHSLSTIVERDKLLEQNFVREIWDHETRDGV